MSENTVTSLCYDVLIGTRFRFEQLYCMYGSAMCGFCVCTKTFIVTEHNVFYLWHTIHTTRRHQRSSKSTFLYSQTDLAGGIEPHNWLVLVATSCSSECSTWCQLSPGIPFSPQVNWHPEQLGISQLRNNLTLKSGYRSTTTQNNTMIHTRIAKRQNHEELTTST